MNLSSLKTAVMILGLASLTAAATGCFWLFSGKKGPPPQESCEGLEGKLKEECEARREGR